MRPREGRDPRRDLIRLVGKIDGTQTLPRPERGGSSAVPGLVETLTAREFEVLGLLAAGRSSRHIAARLVVSLDTVKQHLSQVLDKLRADKRTEAVARPEELGVVP